MVFDPFGVGDHLLGQSHSKLWFDVLEQLVYIILCFWHRRAYVLLEVWIIFEDLQQMLFFTEFSNEVGLVVPVLKQYANYFDFGQAISHFRHRFLHYLLISDLRLLQVAPRAVLGIPAVLLPLLDQRIRLPYRQFHYSRSRFYDFYFFGVHFILKMEIGFSEVCERLFLMCFEPSFQISVMNLRWASWCHFLIDFNVNIPYFCAGDVLGRGLGTHSLLKPLFLLPQCYRPIQLLLEFVLNSILNLGNMATFVPSPLPERRRFIINFLQLRLYLILILFSGFFKFE